MILVVLTGFTIRAYGDYRKAEGQISRYKDELNFIKKYKMGTIFLQNPNIFIHQNNSYINTYFNEIISLLTNMENYDVKNDQLDYLILYNMDISILLALFPFLLKTPSQVKRYVADPTGKHRKWKQYSGWKSSENFPKISGRNTASTSGDFRCFPAGSGGIRWSESSTWDGGQMSL